MKRTAATLVIGLAVVSTTLTGCSEATPRGDGASGPEVGASRVDTDEKVSPEIGAGPLRLVFTVTAATATSEAVGSPVSPQMKADLSVAEGATVDVGQKIGELRTRPEIVSELTARARSSSIDAASLAALQSRERPLRATVSGTLRSSPNGPVIGSNGLDAVAPLTPVQLLRFGSLDFDGSAQVETVLGPRRVNCSALWVTTSSESDAQNAGSLHCRLPQRLESAPGLRASVTLEATPVKGLVVPTLFVGYDPDKDEYFLNVDRQGKKVRVSVTAGPTNGVQRIVGGAIRVGEKLRPVTS